MTKMRKGFRTELRNARAEYERHKAHYTNAPLTEERRKEVMEAIKAAKVEVEKLQAEEKAAKQTLPAGSKITLPSTVEIKRSKIPCGVGVNYGFKSADRRRMDKLIGKKS
jgi:hypothetical protein